MKKAVAGIVAVVALFVAYRYYDASYAPVTRYKKFAEEVLKRHYDAAAAMCDGLTAKDLEALGTQEHIGAGPAMFQTLFPSQFAIESQEKSDDGTITINSVQTVHFNPAGVESVRPAMYATLRQTTKLKRSGGAWMIVAFRNDFEKMESMTSR